MLRRFCFRLLPKLAANQFLLSIWGLIVCAHPVAAAEQVILKYSIFRESISVAELTTLAQTGQASSKIEAYLALVNRSPQELQRVWAFEANVDPVMLSQLLNSFPGEFILTQIGTTIHTPSQRADKEALRGALVTSAMPDGKLSLIEVLENYPTQEVHIEGDNLVELYSQLKGMMDSISRLQF